uniref:Uncharacterized protein n=1 Tax=Anguilla anguilla TaxID=7936 RepID=A0A0E9WNZ5_ANGAN
MLFEMLADYTLRYLAMSVAVGLQAYIATSLDFWPEYKPT